MMRPRHILFCSLFLCSFAVVAVAQTALDEFERGNTFYREGKFGEAAGVYEAILRQGSASAPLYFNLGNSYYRLGKTAFSILAYERALRLQPNDADAKHNLALLNLKTVDRIEQLPDLFLIEWLRALSAVVPPHTTTWLFAIAWAFLFTGLASLSLFNRETLLRIIRGVTLVAFIALIPLALFMIMQNADAGSRSDAIVTATTATVKTSPDAQSVDAFVIHEGLKVKLSDAVGGWVKMVLADGKVGWIRSEDCERI